VAYVWDYSVHTSELTGPSGIILEVIGDAGSLCTLAAAWAYARGRDFSLPATVQALVILGIFLSIWYLGWWLLPRTFFLSLVREAPGIVLACVSTVALGWVFFVRWGGFAGSLYFLARIGYSILELPANLRYNMGQYIRSEALESLDIAFVYLAAGKIVLVGAFLSLLCRSTPEAMEEPQFAPNGGVILNRDQFTGLLWNLAVAFVMAIIAGVLIEKIKASSYGIYFTG